MLALFSSTLNSYLQRVQLYLKWSQGGSRVVLLENSGLVLVRLVLSKQLSQSTRFPPFGLG